MAADGGITRARVFVEDARHNGQFLRATWHGERQQFVLSNWEGAVCVGATRVPVDEAPALVGLLVEGLAEAAARPVAPAPPRTLRQHLHAWWGERGHRATVVPLSAVRSEPGQPGGAVRSSSS
jgi:hypothetical protein